MIIVFLIALVMVLIIANMLVSATRKSPNAPQEKGFSNPVVAYEEPEVEVIQNPRQEVNEESFLIINGAIRATNKKLELINERVSMMEKVLAEVVEKKISTP